jgi:transcription antitermination factor NusG
MKKSAQSERRWLVVKTKPNAEKKVAERLVLKNLEVYLPLYTTLKQWSDRKKKVQKPLISSTIFVRISEEDREQLWNVVGVSGMLYYLGKPAVARDEEILILQQMLQEGIYESVELGTTLIEGQEVEITVGDFKGLRGIVQEEVNAQKVVIALKGMGAQVVFTLKKGAVRLLRGE